MEKTKQCPVHSLKFEDIWLNSDDGSQLFTNVSFDFPSNEVFHVKGSGGISESTLLKVLSGLQPSSSGSYLINDEAVEEMTFNEFVPYTLNMGYSFDYGGLINNRTIAENLFLPIQYHNIMGSEDSFNHVLKYLKMFDLQEVLNKRPSEIPGGMRKAACVARALILNPEILILDEPTAGLRNKPRESLINYINEQFESGKIKYAFVSSLDKKFVQRTCTKNLNVDIAQFEVVPMKAQRTRKKAV